MNIENLLIKRYALETAKTKEELEIRKDYYLRIRGKEKNLDINVYYNGILMYHYTQKQGLTLNQAVFVPNTKNIFKDNIMVSAYDVKESKEEEIKRPKNVIEHAKTVEEMFQFLIGTTRNKTINFKLASVGKDSNEEERNELCEEVKNKTKTIKAEISGEKEPKMYLTLERNEISFCELYDLCIFLIKITICDGIFNESLEKKGKNRYFGSPSLSLMCKLKEECLSLSEEDFIEKLEEIDKAMRKRIDVYASKIAEDGTILEHKYIDEEGNYIEYLNTKSASNQEKAMQQKFMCMLNTLDKDIYYRTNNSSNILYSKNTYPFELEYIMYMGKPSKDENGQKIELDVDEKRSQSNVKGRIDNVAVDGNTLRLIEIKYGNGVIGGTNGIHKHLMDMYSCLNFSKKETLNEFAYRIKERNDALDRKTTVNLDSNLIYDIICIYNDNSKECNTKEAVLNELNRIYNKKCSDKEVKLGLDEEDYSDESSVDKYDTKLKEMNVSDLMNKCRDLGCIVRIILVNNEFNDFEEYNI